MPAKKKSATKKTSSGSGPKSKRIVSNKMQKTMHEYKQHELSSGRGGKVKNRKQAIAIGLSEARRSGANIPPNPKKRASKKAGSAKNTASKRGAARTSAKRATARKPAAKKSPAKKSSAKKSASKKR